MSKWDDPLGSKCDELFVSNWELLTVERKLLDPPLLEGPASKRVSKCPLSNLGDPKLDDAPSPLGDDAVEKRGEDVRIDSIAGGRPEGESIRPRLEDESIRPRPEVESRLEESVLMGC